MSEIAFQLNNKLMKNISVIFEFYAEATSGGLFRLKILKFSRPLTNLIQMISEI